MFDCIWKCLIVFGNVCALDFSAKIELQRSHEPCAAMPLGKRKVAQCELEDHTRAELEQIAAAMEEEGPSAQMQFIAERLHAIAVALKYPV
jgi:hypothetical protein